MISALIFGSGVMLACIIYYSYYLVKSFGYKGSDYQLNTQKKYSQVLSDKGAYGEYLTYKYLKRIKPNGFFLFNVYIPKKSGDTAELDIIFIHQSGIYVFESKNYSGIIYGLETQKTWTQILPGGGKKSKSLFYNPIMQNEGHIKWLKALLADIPGHTFHSCIVFSNHCTLMNAYTFTGNVSDAINLLNKKLTGHYRYYGVSGNYKGLMGCINGMDVECKSTHIAYMQPNVTGQAVGVQMC